MPSLTRLAASGLLAVSSLAAWSQMVSPSIDRADKPFSYFSKPTDQIGVAGAPIATEITPEGFLYTSNGELVFFVGAEQKLLETNDGGRIRTLEDGYIPVENFDVERDGLIYHFQMFSASMGAQPEGAVANFIRVRVENPTSEQKAAFLSTGFRYTAPNLANRPFGENRFRRPNNETTPGAYAQPGDEWNPNWTYGYAGDTALRNGKVVYLFDTAHKPKLLETIKRHYNTRAHVVPGKEVKMQGTTPTTPYDVVAYSFPVAPGKSETLEFKMPLVPVASDTPAIKAMQAARYDDYHARVVKYWRETVAQGVQISVPEQKADDLFRTCLVNDLLSLNHIGDNWIQTVNQTHYHGFYLRDSSDFVRMYDVSGYPKTAENVLNFFSTKQQPDGNFLSQRGEFDGWGQTLWIYGYHVRFTHDRAFAEKVYPSVLRAIDWFEKESAADPLHLMPATDVRDNEYIPGHLTGYNFLALDGLQGAIALANELGKKDDAARFQHDYDKLKAAFMPILKQRAAEKGGYIPPALDGKEGGTDWGNLLSVVPEPQLDPHDPMVTATLDRTRKGYEEGLIIYDQPGQGKFLHHYLGIKNSLTALVRDEQEQAVREFYALLLHTSSTNSGFEFAIRPWGDRDFQGNLAPHGWFAAEFRNLFRNMMLREENDNTLHLLSAISPDWVGGSKKITVTDAPTMFGNVDMELVSTGDNSAELKLRTAFNAQAAAKKSGKAGKHTAATTGVPSLQKLVVHIPWFMDVQSITVDGKKMTPSNVALEIPVNTRSVKFTWSRRPNAPSLSYASTVDAYKTEYAKRYADYLKTGIPYAQ